MWEEKVSCISSSLLLIESLELNCEFGKFSIFGRPGWCDRGRYYVIVDVLGPCSQIFNFISNAYYFNLGNAKAEVESWIEVATDLNKKGKSDNIEGENQSDKPVKLWVCDGCTIALVPYQALFPCFIAGIQVIFDEEGKPKVHVGDASGWPRVYQNEAIAHAEIEFWLNQHGQVLSELCESHKT